MTRVYGAHNVKLESLIVLSWNIRGFTPPAILELIRMIDKFKPDIICLQETRNAAVPLDGYNFFIGRSWGAQSQHGVTTYIAKDLGPTEAN